MTFRIEQPSYRGPLDLLLYLVRKHEIDVAEISISKLTDQFLEYLEVLEVLDVDSVGDFLDMASTLLEIKSRQVLPRMLDEEQEEISDPREELVSRLLEYKKFKDAATLLEEQSKDWQQRYPRLADDLPPRQINLEEQPIQEVELWDLVSALGRLIKENQSHQPSNIVYDETPIHVYMQRIHEQLQQGKAVAFSELFAPGMHKSAAIGVFLAILELVRHHSVITEQDDLHGEIWIHPGRDVGRELDLQAVDTYDPHGTGEQPPGGANPNSQSNPD